MTEETFVRELERRAGQVHGAPTTFDAVRGRARRIRRRRAAGAVAAVAVVAAVVAPVALISQGDGRHEPSPAPSPTTATDWGQYGAPTLQDGVIVYQDGPRIPLPGSLRDSAQAFAVLGGDRYVVERSTGEDREGVLVDSTGTVLAQFPLSGSLAAAADNSSVAWIGTDRSLRLLVAGSEEPRVVDLDGRPTQVAGISGDCADTCTVAVRSEGGDVLGTSELVRIAGDQVTSEPAAVPAVVDLSPDGSLAAGLDSIAADDIHACGGVSDTSSGDVLWDGCEDNIYDFSPDGALVATTFGEGLGPNRIDVRDARSGVRLVGLEGAWISSWAWADDTHLLVVRVHDDGATSVEQLAVDDAGRGEASTVLDGFHTEPDAIGAPVVLPSQ